MSLDVHIPKIPNTIWAFITLSLPPLSLSWLFNSTHSSPCIHRRRLCPFLIQPPFHAILRIHRYTFCHLPSPTLSPPLLPPYPIHHLTRSRLSQTGSDSQTKAFAPPPNPSSLLTCGPQPFPGCIQIGTETSGKILFENHRLINQRPSSDLLRLLSHTSAEGQRYSSQRDSVAIMVKTHELTGGGPWRDSMFWRSGWWIRADC